MTFRRMDYVVPLALHSMTKSRLTVELTRRRESKLPSPHQVSCETRSRRSRPTIWLFGGTVEQVVPIIAAATLEVEQPRFGRRLHLRMARITALSVSYLTPGSPLTKTVRCSGSKSPICCRIQTGISVNVSLFCQ